MLTTLALAVALFSPTLPTTHTPSGRDDVASSDSKLPRFIELKPDADDKVRIDVVRLKDGPRFRTEAKIVIIMRRELSRPDPNARTTPEDNVAIQQALLQSHDVLRLASKRLANEKLRTPPPNGDYLRYLYGLTVTRLKDSTTGAFGNVLSIAFVSPAAEDGTKVVNAIIEGYRDSLTVHSDSSYDIWKSIIIGRDQTLQKLQEAQVQFQRVHERIRNASPLIRDELRSRIIANESVQRSLQDEKIDIEFNLSLLQRAIKDGKDKAVVLYFLKVTNDFPLLDDQAKADRLKQKTDELFELCLDSAKMKLDANKLKIAHLERALDNDRIASRSLDESLIEEKPLLERIERIRKQADAFEERLQQVELARDLPLAEARVITPPTTVNLKSNFIERVELADVKDLCVTTAGGKEVTKEEALKALAKGGLVVVSTDGKAVPTNYLKMFKDDVLVLFSPEFVGAGAR